MKKSILILFAAVFLAACSNNPTAPASSTFPELTQVGDGEAVSGEILVKYKGGVSLSSVSPLSGSKVLESTLSDNWGTLSRIQVPKGQELSFVRQYSQLSGVEYAEPNFWVPAERNQVQLTRIGTRSSVLNPTDPYLTEIPPQDPFATAGAHNPSGVQITGVNQASLVIGSSTLPVAVQISTRGTQIQLSSPLSSTASLVGQGTLQTNGRYLGVFTIRPNDLGTNPCPNPSSTPAPPANLLCSSGSWSANLVSLSQQTSPVDARGTQTRGFSFSGTANQGPLSGNSYNGTLSITLKGIFTYDKIPWLWGIHRIRSPEAWAEGITGQGSLVAIIDDGADLTHPDIAPNLWTNPNPNNSVCPGLHGYDFANEDSDPTDTNGHGTHTAGTVAAAANNHGVVGVAPEAKLIIVKGLGFLGGTTYMLTRALKYAADCGANVSNNSWGGASKSKAFEDAMRYGVAKGHVYVFAAGNGFDGGNAPSDPVGNSTQIAGVIGVGAISANNLRTGFSNTGKYVTVAAPGNAILSTIPQEQGNPGDPYGFLQGTSMAAPHVTGVVALMFSANPHITPLQVRVALEQTANSYLTGQLARPDYNSIDAGWYGYGLVDAKAAVDYVKANY